MIPKPKFIRDIEIGRNKRIAKKKELDDKSLLSKEDLKSRASEKVNLSVLARTETLAIDTDQVVPLLSEGALWQDDYARGYIPRGEIAKMVDKLNSDFVGGFNVGHSDYFTDPSRGWVGNWTKSDLSIEDIDDDRQRVNVSLGGLFQDMAVLNDLTIEDRPLGLSIEIYHDWDDFVEIGDYIVPVWRNLEIVGIAIVGSTGDPINEDTIKLNKEDNMPLLKKKKKEELEVQDDASQVDEPSTEEQEEQEEQEEVADETPTVREEEKLETAEEAIAEVEAEVKAEQDNLAVEQLAKVKEDLAKVTSERDHYRTEFAKLKVHLSELAKSSIMVEKTSLELKKDQKSTSTDYVALAKEVLK